MGAFSVESLKFNWSCNSNWMNSRIQRLWKIRSGAQKATCNEPDYVAGQKQRQGLQGLWDSSAREFTGMRAQCKVCQTRWTKLNKIEQNNPQVPLLFSCLPVIPCVYRAFIDHLCEPCDFINSSWELAAGRGPGWLPWSLVPSPDLLDSHPLSSLWYPIIIFLVSPTSNLGKEQHWTPSAGSLR